MVALGCTRNSARHRDTWVYIGSGLRRVKPYVQLVLYCLYLREKTSCPRKGTLGRLILAGGLGFSRSVDREFRSVTMWKAISTDYKQYPVISGLVGAVAPPLVSCFARQVLRRSPGLWIRSSGPTCRLAGHLAGQTHLSRTFRTLTRWGPLDTMSITYSFGVQHN
jgi:hypothetical protein